jgi:hypothetical protein
MATPSKTAAAIPAHTTSTNSAPNVTIFNPNNQSISLTVRQTLEEVARQIGEKDQAAETLWKESGSGRGLMVLKLF